MPTPRRGNLWLVRFPFTDLTAFKVRPALIVSVHGEDAIIAGIFSRLPAHGPRNTWVIVEDRHPGFHRTGLQKTSVIRAEKVATVHRSILVRRLGTLPHDLLSETETALRRALSL